MRRIIIKSLFCPNNKYYKITANSLINLFDYLTYFNVNNADIILIGWANIYSSQLEKLVTILNKNKYKINYELFDINYGKYKIFDNMVQISKLDIYSTLYYFDHDIQILPEYNLFSVDINGKIDGKNIGILAVNHTEDIRHQLTVYENECTVNNHTVVYPVEGDYGSVADGCFIGNCECIKNMKFSMINVYGLDDYYLIKQVDELNFSYGVLKNIFVEHPYDDNVEYTMWKKQQIVDIVNNNNSYYKSVESFINLFNIQ